MFEQTKSQMNNIEWHATHDDDVKNAKNGKQINDLSLSTVLSGQTDRKSCAVKATTKITINGVSNQKPATKSLTENNAPQVHMPVNNPSTAAIGFE